MEKFNFKVKIEVRNESGHIGEWLEHSRMLLQKLKEEGYNATNLKRSSQTQSWFYQFEIEISADDEQSSWLLLHELLDKVVGRDAKIDDIKKL